MPVCVGISALYHDAACCLIRDGELVAAAQEERFSRMKHDPRVPINAFAYCLDAAGCSVDDVDCVAYYEDPARKLERIVWSLSMGVGDLGQILSTWEEKTATLEYIADRLDLGCELRCYDHHLSHGASAYYASPFADAAIMTVDGVGEWATTSLMTGRDGELHGLESIDFPHSWGLFYSALTSFLGFRPNSDEYKVMGLAALGSARFLPALRRVVEIDPSGRFRLDMGYFDYNQRMFSRALGELLGVPPRSYGEELRPVHQDIAASAQALLEDGLVRLARNLHERTGLTDLCLAGGVALNCVANARLKRDTPFQRVFVQPAAGDAGGALGAAMLAHRELTGSRPRPMQHLYLGPSYPAAEIRRYLRRIGACFEELDPGELVARTAAELAKGKVVGWFQGGMEFGPRALGARSILADPRRADMQDILNHKIKQRESFRPFAPVCPSSEADTHFECPDELPYMTVTVGVRDPAALPAVSHVNATARLQTVDPATAPRLAALLRSFGELTGMPVLINTSFNRAGEPIVCSPMDAFSCFRESGIDLLVMDTLLIDRADQDPGLITAGSHPYLALAREVVPYLRDTYFFS